MTHRTSSIAAVFALLSLAACGTADSDPPSPNDGVVTPPPRGEEGAQPSTPSAPPPPPPVVGEPEEAELTEAYGVFVVAGAQADGQGTRESPLGTISAGIARAKSEGKRVYVCAGTFNEAVTLENGIPVVGGFDCGQHRWKRAGARSRIESPSSPALRAKDITTPTRFDGFEVVAPDAVGASASSIGLIAENSGGLEIVKSKLEAGAAGDGADGTEGIQLTLGSGAKGGNGQMWAMHTSSPLAVVTWRSGGEGGVGACVGAPGHDGESGGDGGSGGTYVCKELSKPQPNGLFLKYDGWDWYRNLAGTPFTRTDGEDRTGVRGTDGADGASASTIGAFTPSGYAPANGRPGAHGSPGKGGYGAGGESSKYGNACDGRPRGTTWYGADGPGGGAGGCPGLAGTPGTGGGASVAALVFASEGLTFDACELVARRGGRGGRGTLGSLATAGGAPGAALGATLPAQAGGAGGRAGVSGSGAGGPSIALAHSGAAPKLVNGTSTKAGLGGAGVPEQSKAGYAATVPASAAGIAKEVFSF